MIPGAVQRLRWPAFAAVQERAVATASGTVLEVGAGTGANFDAFVRDITWIGAEPHAPSRSALERSARARGHLRPVLDSPCESIALGDGAVDCVVGTFVMCSVRDVARSLAEFRRVLAPGGRLILVDHLAAEHGSGTRMLQNLVSPLSRLVDKGCRYNREVTEALPEAGFREPRAHWYRVGVFPGIWLPCAVHTARA